jgi:hypothetical protein
MDAKRVDALLKVRGLKRSQLAEMIDVGDYMMTKWLVYGQSPSGYDVARIALVLDVDAADLYQLEREPTVWSRLRVVLGNLPPEKRAAVVAFAEALVQPEAPEPTLVPRRHTTGKQRRQNGRS